MAKPDLRDTRSLLLLTVGAFLLVGGASLLTAIGLAVLDVISSPDEVKLVALILESRQADAGGLSGNFGTASFSIQVDEPFLTFFFLVLLIWVLGALASIVKVLVGTGKDLVVAARSGSGHDEP